MHLIHPQRRTVIASLLALGTLGPAWAQGPEWRPLKSPVPTDAPAGKIEVVEFFWYGCPHCFSLEPVLRDWRKTLAADVQFRKVHVPWQVQAHQQLFVTLDVMGEAERLNDKVFSAIHTERNRLDQPEAMADLVARNGVDRKRFLETYASFGVKSKMQRATQLAAAYELDGVPALGVAGRFLTAPSMAGGNERALRVVDQLVAQVRKGG